jgi:hypothetical protein
LTANKYLRNTILLAIIIYFLKDFEQALRIHEYRWHSGVNSSGGIIIACSNSGGVSGTSFVGGVIGNNSIGGSFAVCYFLTPPPPGFAQHGIGANGVGITGGDSPADAREFSGSQWPATGASPGQSPEWGIGDGSGSGKYWKTLGSWNSGNNDRDSTFPTLWWEP